MYKCPYQPIIREVTKNGNKTTYTEFGNCLQTSCPWWKTEQQFDSGLFIPGCCMRVTSKIQTNNRLER